MKLRALMICGLLTAVACAGGDDPWSRVAHDEKTFGGAGDQLVFAVAAGGPGVVGVGWDQVGRDDWDAAIWTSTDGSGWDRVPGDVEVFGGEGFQSIRGIVASDATLVAVGGDGSGDGRAAVWTSDDGLAWSRAPDPDGELDGEGSQRMNAVAAHGGRFTAVGIEEAEDGGAVSTRAAVWTSADGRSWTRHRDAFPAHDGSGEQHPIGVTVHDGRWVAAGWTGGVGHQQAAIWWSDDGQRWAAASGDTFSGSHARSVRAIASGPGGIVAVGSINDGTDVDAAVWTSPDGETWTSVGAADAFGGPETQQMFAVGAVGDGYIAVGREGAGGAAWSSRDGADWSRTVQDSFGEEDITVLRGLAVAGDRVVAAGGATSLGGSAPDERAAFWTAPAG